MTTENNPAARFHRLIVEGRKLEVRQPAHKNFGRLLGVKGRSAIFKAVAEVMELPRLVDDVVTSLASVNQELLLRWVPKAEATFEALNLDGEWGAFIKPYDDHVLFQIENCADTLSRLSPEDTIDEHELGALEALVGEVLAELKNSGLESELHDLIKNRTEEIELALRLYRVKGIGAVRSAFATTVGSIVVQPQAAREHLANFAPSSWWDLVKKLAVVVTLMNGVVELGKDVNEVMLWLPTRETTHASAHKAEENIFPTLEMASVVENKA